MPTVYQSQPGVAVSFPVAEDVPIPIAFDEWEKSTFPKFRSIIVQMSVERSGNYQIVHTLKDLVYIYVFGERVGNIRLSGISFAGGCDDRQGKTGVEHVLEYYEKNCISRRAKPLTIQIGAGTSGHFIGFLTDMQIVMQQPEARLSQFAFQFKTFPR